MKEGQHARKGHYFREDEEEYLRVSSTMTRKQPQEDVKEEAFLVEKTGEA